MALNDENGGGIPATMLVGPTGYGGYPMYGGGNNNGFGGDGNGWWIILLFILLASGNWGNGWGNNGGGNGYNGQPVIINDGNYGCNGVQRGFDQAAIMGAINGVQTGVQGIATQLCNGFANVNATVNGGVNALAQQMYANQIADMQTAFAGQTAQAQGFNALQSQLAQCCCDNRAGIADLRYTIATENCADRAAISDGIRDVITNQTAGVQRILDQLCQDKIDAKNERIADLERQLQMANLAASQVAQTAQIRAGQVAEIDAMYQRMRDCPVPTMPVYGMQPIFTCPNNGGGCGCGNA